MSENKKKVNINKDDITFIQKMVLGTKENGDTVSVLEAVGAGLKMKTDYKDKKGNKKSGKSRDSYLNGPFSMYDSISADSKSSKKKKGKKKKNKKKKGKKNNSKGLII